MGRLFGICLAGLRCASAGLLCVLIGLLRASHVLVCASAGILCASAGAQEDPYAHYVRTSEDFAPVLQKRDWAMKAWPGWIYMPWPYRWTIGYDDAAAEWCRTCGYNGAQLDHGRPVEDGINKLEWINEHGFRFYTGHLAGKGDLHLWDAGEVGPHWPAVRSCGVRPVSLDAALQARLEKRIAQNLEAVKASPYRSAYALDDEPSWGHLAAPCMWRAVGDRAAYDAWLAQVYGAENAPAHEGWIGYDALWSHLGRWSVRDFDASQLMDQLSFNDSISSNLIGRLVRHANRLDPSTPCGIVGAQAPNPFGGYDYAKLMNKVQFIEAYDLGGSQSIIRSFNPQNALPVVTTHFHRLDEDRPGDAAETIRQVWYYLAHGNAGMIGWVDHWFDADKKPLPWHETAAPHYREAGEKIGPLVRGAAWMHDGVAIYYSHASIQLGWILDAQTHGGTWRNRKEDHRVGSAPLVRRAWENMLRDEGLQYDFISYARVIKEGIPDCYKVLILPATLCLSDCEARIIEAFCRQGGVVIADYLPGLFDEHGRGRKTGGALDKLFGVKHDPTLKASDIFQERHWAEVDQEARYSDVDIETFLTLENSCLTHSSGFHKAVREMGVLHTNDCGQGKAILMNLSPQMYNAFRARGRLDAARREIFMHPVRSAGVRPWVRIYGAAETVHGYEITYWDLDGRILLFLCQNPGGRRLKTDEVETLLVFNAKINKVRNERSGESLGDGRGFTLTWKMNEAIVLSFEIPE